MKNLISFLLYLIGLTINKNRSKILSIYFHNPKPRNFEKIITWLFKHGYQVIDLPTFLSYINGTENLAKKSVYISFDDAWKGNLDLLPIIEKYNVPITIFSPIQPLEEGNYWWEFVNKEGGRNLVKQVKTYPSKTFKKTITELKKKLHIDRSAMTKQQLIAIAQHPLVDVQSHSYSHPILTQLDETELQTELEQSQKELSQLLNKEIYAFSYPNGSLSKREIEAVSKYYKCAFTTQSNYPSFGSNPLAIPRIALADDYWSNLAKMMGTWKIFKKLFNKLGYLASL